MFYDFDLLNFPSPLTNLIPPQGLFESETPLYFTISFCPPFRLSKGGSCGGEANGAVPTPEPPEGKLGQIRRKT